VITVIVAIVSALLVITSFVLRRVVRAASPDKLDEHWPGSPDGLAALRRLLRLPPERSPI
jgi:hypothetical protein